jgi:hypothetical protein
MQINFKLSENLFEVETELRIKVKTIQIWHQIVTKKALGFKI